MTLASASGVPLARQRKLRLDCWLPKLERNRTRDLKVASALESLGWSVLVDWECQMPDDETVPGRGYAAAGATDDAAARLGVSSQSVISVVFRTVGPPRHSRSACRCRSARIRSFAVSAPNRDVRRIACV